MALLDDGPWILQARSYEVNRLIYRRELFAKPLALLNLPFRGQPRVGLLDCVFRVQKASEDCFVLVTQNSPSPDCIIGQHVWTDVVCLHLLHEVNRPIWTHRDTGGQHSMRRETRRKISDPTEVQPTRLPLSVSSNPVRLPSSSGSVKPF